jgi:Cu(I)/Ag(I) efflux system membrane fusion protein
MPMWLPTPDLASVSTPPRGRTSECAWSRRRWARCPAGLTVTGAIDFNQRDVGIVQTRSGGFVVRVYARAPGDVIGAGAPIADLQLPEWGGAQGEYLAVRRLGRADLTAAARQRLKLMGMSDALIGAVERTGRTNGTVTIRSPIGGVIQTLDVRAGMALAAGQSLAQVSGIGTVWLNAAVPEAQAGLVRTGQGASATLAAFPGRELRRTGSPRSCPPRRPIATR